MLTKNEVKELQIALHRKLINVNADIRTQRKRKDQDKTINALLKEKRKCVDATLSACKLLYINFESQQNPKELYLSYNRLYRSL